MYYSQKKIAIIADINREKNNNNNNNNDNNV